jgi:hypothetical protein
MDYNLHQIGVTDWQGILKKAPRLKRQPLRRDSFSLFDDVGQIE